MNRRTLIIPVALIALALITPSAFGRGRSHGGGGHGGGGHGGGGHPHPASAPHPHAPSHPQKHVSNAPKQHPTAPKNHASAAAAPRRPVAHNTAKHAPTSPQAPKAAGVKTANTASAAAPKPLNGKKATAATTDTTVTKPATPASAVTATRTGTGIKATTGIGGIGSHSRGYAYNRNANPNTIAPMLMIGAMTNPNFSGRNWGYHHHYYGGYHRGYRRRWYNNNGMYNNIAYRHLMRLKHDLDMIRPGMTLQNRHTQYLSRDLIGVVRPGNQRPPTPVVHNLAAHVATALTHRTHRSINTLMLAKHLAVIMNYGGGNPNQMMQSMNGGTSLLRSAGVPVAENQQIGRDLQMVAMSGNRGAGGFLN